MFIELSSMLFWVVAVALTIYASSMMIAIAAGALVWLNADWWTVDNNDPDARVSRLGVLRDVDPLEMTAAWKGGRPMWPVFQESGQRVTLRGLRNKSGLRRGVLSDWTVVFLGDDEPYPHPIQSSWGYFSPIYLFRKMVYHATGRHVIRVWFPFILFGFWEIIRPVKATYIRAIPRGRPLRAHQSIEEPEDTQLDRAKVKMARDTTDHALLIFTHDILTNGFPLTSGHSVRIQTRLILQLENLQQLLSFKDWSSVLNGAVGNVSGMHLSGKSLEVGYARLLEEADGLNTEYQDAVSEWLTSAEKNPFLTRVVDGEERTLSVVKSLGLVLKSVQYVDIEPADSGTEEDMRRIMSMRQEGDAKAYAAGKMAAALGAEPEGATHVARIEAARNARHIDWIVGDGGETAATGYRARTARNTARGESS